MAKGNHADRSRAVLTANAGIITVARPNTISMKVSPKALVSA